MSSSSPSAARASALPSHERDLLRRPSTATSAISYESAGFIEPDSDIEAFEPGDDDDDDDDDDDEDPSDEEDDTESGVIEVNPALVLNSWAFILLAQYDDDDADSDYFTGGRASGTTSLFSSAFNYEFENGRRYHSFRSGKYLMPNDMLEQERLDIYHYLNLLMLDGKLHVSPVEKRVKMKVLDVGTGTGIWAIDFADTHPDSEVVGVDLSPIQSLSIPTNLRFEIDDVESEWTYQDNEFDFIHIRHLSASIRDWPRLFAQAFRCLKPGGYIEVCEASCQFYSDDNSLPADSAIAIFSEIFNQLSDQQGLGFTKVSRFKDKLLNVGFESIQVTERKLPLGPWAKDEKLRYWGELAAKQRELGGTEAHALALFTRVGGMHVDEVRKIIEDVNTTVSRRDVHVYTKQHWFTGRKPRRRRGEMDKVDE